jgi:hypothetical protein
MAGNPRRPFGLREVHVRQKIWWLAWPSHLRGSGTTTTGTDVEDKTLYAMIPGRRERSLFARQAHDDEVGGSAVDGGRADQISFVTSGNDLSAILRAADLGDRRY